MGNSYLINFSIRLAYKYTEGGGGGGDNLCLNTVQDLDYRLGLTSLKLMILQFFVYLQ